MIRIVRHAENHMLDDPVTIFINRLADRMAGRYDPAPGITLIVSFHAFFIHSFYLLSDHG